MYRRLSVLTVVMLLMAISGMATDNPEESALVVSVSGEVSKDGELLTLSLEPGKVATHAIRVYSEPSHTLVSAVIDSDFYAKAESWISSWVEVDRPLATMTTDLPEGAPRVSVLGKPKRDNRIAVYVYGTWPDGSIGETLVADAKVGQGSFSFSTSIVVEKADGWPPIEFEHCCLANDVCVKVCKKCPDKAFTCCPLKGCCWIQCGWDGAACTCADCTCYPS